MIRVDDLKKEKLAIILFMALVINPAIFLLCMSLGGYFITGYGQLYYGGFVVGLVEFILITVLVGICILNKKFRAKY